MAGCILDYFDVDELWLIFFIITMILQYFEPLVLIPIDIGILVYIYNVYIAERAPLNRNLIE